MDRRTFLRGGGGSRRDNGGGASRCSAHGRGAAATKGPDIGVLCYAANAEEEGKFFTGFQAGFRDLQSLLLRADQAIE